MTSPTTLSLLDVPDVLHHIFAYLDPLHQQQYDQIYECRRSLALAARACWGFAGPALDVLWKRLPDDQPLADLLCEVGIATKEGEVLEPLGENKPGRYQLPDQGWRRYCRPGAAEAQERRWKLSRGYDTQYLLRRDIGDPRKHPGWLRFAAYASRVRAITLFAFDGPAWTTIWEELGSDARCTPILPNLLSVAFCRISWSAPTPGIFALIQSPSVRTIDFSLENVYAWAPHDEKLRCLFSQIINIAPQIDKLQLAMQPSCLGPSFLHCSRLRYLEVHPQLEFEGLRLLVELPALERLSVSLIRENLPGSHTPFTLKSLTNFDVGGTWTNLGVLFDTVRLPAVRSLTVTGWAYGEPAAELAKGAIECFRTISALRASITSLSISASYAVPQGCVIRGVAMVNDTFQAPFLDLIHPLLSLSVLRHLSLALPSYFDLAYSAADMRAVAESFRALETLHLRIGHCEYLNTPEKGVQDPNLNLPCGAPLDAIAHFARNCPRLRVLHLPPMELTLAESDDSESLAPGVPLGDELEGSERRVVNIGVGNGTSDEPHGLRTLIIPRVLLPRGREDLAGKVEEVVRSIFPLAASPFLLERLAMKENWVLVDWASTCPECSAGKISALA